MYDITLPRRTERKGTSRSSPAKGRNVLFETEAKTCKSTQFERRRCVVEQKRYMAPNTAKGNVCEGSTVDCAG